jgi:hypothetical protein
VPGVDAGGTSPIERVQGSIREADAVPTTFE